MSHRRRLLLLLLLSAFAGNLLGRQHRAIESSSGRAPSAWWRGKAPETTIRYESLPCPEEKELRDLAAKVHLQLPDAGELCKHPELGPLAKLLSFASRLTLQIPADWAPRLRADLEDPLGYLSRSMDRLGFDFHQSESIAYKKGGVREVYLGGLFFSQSPLEGLSVLMHEARHNSPDDPGHVICRRGDIPRAAGGCDAALSLSPGDAGAYSYGAAFYAAMGLFARGLAEPDRELMLSEAVATVATRFNRLPENLAEAFDLVVLLEESGRLLLLHPIQPLAIELPLPLLREGERVERIELNVLNSGVLAFTSRQRVFSWDPEDGFSRFYEKRLPESFPVIDAQRIRNLFGDYPFYSFLSSAQDLRYLSYHAESRSYRLQAYRTHPEGVPPPPLRAIFMGLDGRGLFLGVDGRLHLSQKFGSDRPFDARPDLQVPGSPWKQATGGIVYESMYGVTEDGKSWYTKTDYLPAKYFDESEEEVYSIAESSFQAAPPASARKILEGLSFRALLDSDHALHFETYDRQQRSVHRHGAPLRDFALIRSHLPADSLIPSRLSAFRERCQLRSVIPDPWFGIGMGLDPRGRLVIGAPGAQPCLSAGGAEYSEIRLQRSASRKEENPSRERKPRHWLEAESVPRHVVRAIQSDGKVRILRPYDPR